jgi:death-on-curing protein
MSATRLLSTAACSPYMAARQECAILGLLASALARPHQLHAYANNPDVIELAAAYTAGIIRNHPFVDSNKRGGFVVGVLFLEMNGYRLTASEEDATQAVLGLAEGTLDETALVAWMRANSHRNRKKRSTK